jgi:Uma2 family endonuclease
LHLISSDVRLLIPVLALGRHPDLGAVFHDAPKTSAAGTRDDQTKREEYLVFGIQEYGIVDPDLKQLIILSRRDGADGPAWDERIVRDDDPILNDLWPALAARLGEFWAETDL